MPCKDTACPYKIIFMILTYLFYGFFVDILYLYVEKHFEPRKVYFSFNIFYSLQTVKFGKDKRS